MAVKELFSLGKIYPSDFLKPGEKPRSEPIELKLVMDENGLVKLADTAPKEILWGKYFYRSSISTTMRSQLRDVVDSILEVFKIKAKSIWCDIGGNDGYLLSQAPMGVTTVNIDPADDSYKSESEKKCSVTIQDYFSEKVYRDRMGTRNATIISAVSMFYDLIDPDSFLRDVYSVLDDNGLLCVQISYSPLMLIQLEIGNICHEHCVYYSLFNIKPILERNGFIIVDATLNNTNAGSLRLFIMKDKADITKFGSPTHRDVCRFRTDSLLYYENFLGLDEPDIWLDFFDKINELKKQTVDFITEEKKKGKVIIGYAASTKFNTVIQYFGLNSDMITAIAERSPEKYDLVTIGSNIPIISEMEMRKERPDYLLIGAGHFLSEFKERESVLLKTGTKFICIMPKFEIIGA